MTTDEQLRDALEKWREGARQAQLRWVTVDTVDKDNGGMGALCIYPKPGTTCLVGIVEGQETDAFLISANEVDEIVLNGGTLGGLVKVGELTERLNLIEKDINSLKQKLSGWTPVPNDGGSALKTALSSYTSESLKETQVRDIENERVKQ